MASLFSTTKRITAPTAQNRCVQSESTRSHPSVRPATGGGGGQPLCQSRHSGPALTLQLPALMPSSKREMQASWPHSQQRRVTLRLSTKAAGAHEPPSSFPSTLFLQLTWTGPWGHGNCSPCITCVGGQVECQAPGAGSTRAQPRLTLCWTKWMLDLALSPVLVAPGHRGVGCPPLHAVAGPSLPSIHIH